MLIGSRATEGLMVGYVSNLSAGFKMWKLDAKGQFPGTPADLATMINREGHREWII